MWDPPENEQYAEQLYLPGEPVPPGTYQRVGQDRPICLTREDYLPASLDGRVAVYVRTHLWSEHRRDAARSGRLVDGDQVQR